MPTSTPSAVIVLLYAIGLLGPVIALVAGVVFNLVTRAKR